MAIGDTVAALVHAAKAGEQWAWDELVARYTPLIESESMTQGNRLSPAQSMDISQIVWLRLIEHLDDLRDPDSLEGWIAATTRMEVLRLESS